MSIIACGRCGNPILDNEPCRACNAPDPYAERRWQIVASIAGGLVGRFSDDVLCKPGYVWDLADAIIEEGRKRGY
jgi:hypothetical protein